MIETKYGLTYSFPHTLVHIVDNSDHTLTPEVSVAEDPSLYSVLVVTGAPMGEDNKIVNIVNSDILMTAYGMYSLTNSDIKKYGQCVEYASSLVKQGAPVKMLRITPPGSTYGVSTILIQYKVDTVAQKFIVRYKLANVNDLRNKYSIYLDRYKNTDRLNKAICNAYNNYYEDDDTTDGWVTRVFINNISAGRGSDYNNMFTYINKTNQPRRAGDTRYEFGTVDTRSNARVETFIGSLINDASVVNKWHGVKQVDTVNINVAKRPEGSSVIIPYVNEDAIREVYDAYRKFISDRQQDTGDTNNAYYANGKRSQLYDVIFNELNINRFDIIYGKYIYDNGRDDIELDLPLFQVDMFDMDISRLPNNSIVEACKNGAMRKRDGSDEYDEERNERWTADHSVISQTLSEKYYDVNSDDPTKFPVSTMPVTESDTWPSWMVENTVLEGVINKPSAANLVGVTSYNSSCNIGDVFLTNPKYATPYFSIVTEINQYTGNVTYKNIPKVYQISQPTQGVYGVRDSSLPTVPIKAVININSSIDFGNTTSSSASGITTVINNALITYRTEYNLTDGDVVAIVSTSNKLGREVFVLVRVDTSNGYMSHIMYDPNIYRYLDYNSYYAKIAAIKNVMTIKSDTTNCPAYYNLGTLVVNDNSNVSDPTPEFVSSIDHVINQSTGLEVESPVLTSVAKDPNAIDDCITFFKCRVGEPPSAISTDGVDLINMEYDLMIYAPTDDNPVPDLPTWIYRVIVTAATGSTFRVKCESLDIPSNYYSNDFGVSLYSEAGGTPIEGGTTGFFDGDVNSIEYKWKYSELLTQAFRGQIDPRILSPIRVPAKYMFDAAYNTVVGLAQIPFIDPDPKDVILASTIFTNEEKDMIQDNPKLIATLKYADVDVKQAMYDLMIERNYQRIPENKRPVGPGSGMSLHLDSSYADIDTIKIINQSFEKRFDNPNASWDIGGYVDAKNGVTYTWTKRIVDNLITHCKTYTVNKPYANKYTAMLRDEYTQIFPDVDATDWDLRELMYQSGGNSWVADTNGIVTRRSQRTLLRTSATSDLLQESNMRTLSQLVYMLQNKLDTYLLEYDDDGVLKTMSDECNAMFNGWIGSRVSTLSIRFERDTNIDGGDIVVCYVDVTFRGIILRIPIIVNVNKRTNS